MDEITDATCEFGLARTREGCVRSLASYTPDNYRRLQISCIGLGLVAFAIASYKFFRSKLNNGAKLQQRAFLLSMFAAATFVVRGVDPLSYGHYFPRPVGHFIVDACTAAIYTVFILTLEFWNTIIHKGTPSPEKGASRVKWFAYSVIALMWLTKVGVNVALLYSKGFDAGFYTFELLVTAALLLVLCVVFAVYGVRVIHRLEQIDKMNERRLNLYDNLHTSRINMLAVSHTSTAVDDLESTRHDSELPPPPPKPMAGTIPRPPPQTTKKRKPAQKIKEMLIITEIVAILCIVAQVYTGIHSRNGYKELHCANGFECDRISARWPLLHGFQYVTIFVVLFTFRKTKRDRNAAGRLGLVQPVQIV